MYAPLIQIRWYIVKNEEYAALQSQNAVSVHLSSKQILSFVIARQYAFLILIINFSNIRGFMWYTALPQYNCSVEK